MIVLINDVGSMPKINGFCRRAECSSASYPIVLGVEDAQ